MIWNVVGLAVDAAFSTTNPASFGFRPLFVAGSNPQHCRRPAIRPTLNLV
jgi:hypothetical protein